jgi:TonB family protein
VLSENVARGLRDSHAIRACYDAELAHDPTLSGLLRVQFTVLDNGRVSNVFVHESTVSSELAGCVVAIIHALHFSPGAQCGPTTFRFPFIFEPGS